MTSTFFGLNIALSGLQAQQVALNVTSQNVANANTDGYTRQDAQMVAADPFPLPIAAIAGQAGQLGTGVEISSIRRMRDSFLDSQVRSQTSAQGYWDTKQNNLGQIESVFNEPSDQGINSLLTNFWGAWQDLGANPDSYAARVTVIQDASALTDVIQRDNTQLTDLQTSLDGQIQSQVSQVNTWLSEIASLNKQIAAVEVPQASQYDPNVKVPQAQANDLRDQRDLLLDQLSKVMNINYQEASDGTVTIWLGAASNPPVANDPNAQAKQILVQADTQHYLVKLPNTTNANGTTSFGDVVWSTDGDPTNTSGQAAITWSQNDGQLGAMRELRDVTLNPSGVSGGDNGQSLAWRLDQMANSLATLVNNAHLAGYGEDGKNGRLFFVSSDSNPISAANIVVNPDLVSNPNLIGAASAPNQTGNGDQANAIASALQSGTTTIAEGPSTNITTTLSDWYNALISKLGVDSKQAQDMSTNQDLLVNRLTTNRESFSGVSLDEEATNVVRFQRAYEASARVMNAMDEMLDKLVNGVGVVGR